MRSCELCKGTGCITHAHQFEVSLGDQLARMSLQGMGSASPGFSVGTRPASKS
jgi:hypothetical protein